MVAKLLSCQYFSSLVGGTASDIAKYILVPVDELTVAGISYDELVLARLAKTEALVEALGAVILAPHSEPGGAIANPVHGGVHEPVPIAGVLVFFLYVQAFYLAVFWRDVLVGEGARTSKDVANKLIIVLEYPNSVVRIFQHSRVSIRRVCGGEEVLEILWWVKVAESLCKSVCG